MRDKEEIVVLGAGLAGLSVAKYLNGNCTVLEADSIAGGLCRSFEKDGFAYDIGGHILFSKNKSVLSEMISWLGENIHQQRRANFVWYKDRVVKYPFENGLHLLDKEEIFECLTTFLNREKKEATNLEEWCKFRFGDGIADKYLIPYNKKIWKRNLREMSLHWVDRIPSPPTEDIIKSAIGIETEGYTHQLNFYYPERGGIQSLTDSLAQKVADLKLNFRVNKVRKNKDEWEISDGEKTVYANKLISTIPVFDLINSLENVPEKVTQTLAKLQYNSLILVMIGVKHEGLAKRTAFYVPDPNILPHRICFMKYFSQFNAPENYSHLVAEITVPSNDLLLKKDDDFLIKKVVDGVKNICGFKESEVICTDVKRIKYSYVVYDSDYLKNTKVIYDYLNSLGIYYTGRFASFAYINMDKCVEMSKELVEKYFHEIFYNRRSGVYRQPHG
jgi:protoporphyrinogen oxidase